MPTGIELDITTNTTTDIGADSIGQGWSIQLRDATAGTFTFVEKDRAGTAEAVTDEAGNAISITAIPTNVNLFVGAGASIAIVSTLIGGTLKVICKPLKSEK